MRLKVLLPPMLGMFAGMIQAALQKKGSVLLEDHRKLIVIARAQRRGNPLRALRLLRCARNERS